MVIIVVAGGDRVLTGCLTVIHHTEAAEIMVTTTTVTLNTEAIILDMPTAAIIFTTIAEV